MKKILVLVVGLALAASVFASTTTVQSRKFSVGVTGLNISNNNSPAMTGSMNIIPGFTMVGSIGTIINSNSDNVTTGSLFGKFFTKYNNKVNLFCGPSISFYNFKTITTAVSFNAGAEYFIKPNLSFEAYLTPISSITYDGSSSVQLLKGSPAAPLVNAGFNLYF